MPAPSPHVTFINKLPLLAFLPNVVALGREGGGAGRREGWGWYKLLSQVPPLSSLASTGLLIPGYSGLKILTPGVQGLPQIWSQSQETCDYPSCSENLGSSFSYLHFIDGNLRPRGKRTGMAAPRLTVPLYHCGFLPAPH